MKTLHFWIGVIGLIIFALTGQYMEHIVGPLANMDDGPRMMYRSAHLFIMFGAATNLMLGVLMPPFAEGGLSRLVGILRSGLVAISPILALAGFYLESGNTELVRPITSFAAFSMFGAAVLVFGEWFLKKR